MDETTELRRPSGADWKYLKALMTRANGGEQKAIDELRDFLDENPQVWQHVGNLARTAERAWIELIAAKDIALGESIRRQLEQIKMDLVGNAPTAVERMVSDQIAATLLETKYLEATSANTTGTVTQASLLLKRLDSAQRRHLGAIRTLVQVRKLLREAEAKPRLRLFGAAEKTA